MERDWSEDQTPSGDRRPAATQARHLLVCVLLAAFAAVGAMASVAPSAAASTAPSAAVGAMASVAVSAAAGVEGSTSATGQGSSSTVYYAGTRYQPRRLAIKPHGYYHNVSVHGLQWADWGAPQATADGTFTYQFCVEESCSVAPFFDEPVVVSISQIKRCRDGRSSYTTLALTINGSMPDESFKGFQTSVAACPRRRSSGR